MDELIVYKKTVELAPLEDVAKFMLIAPEKAKAQAAEIRAMRNLGVAQEVLAQKEEEQRMLNELILDAGARIGELIKTWPKASGGDRRSEDFKTDRADSFEKPKTKKERGAEYGFTEQDMARYERLSNNKDLIEQEKAQAREENRQPTRTNVLEKAREREKAVKQEKQQAHENQEEGEEEMHLTDEQIKEIQDFANTHPEMSYHELARNLPYHRKTITRWVKHNDNAHNVKSKSGSIEEIYKQVLNGNYEYSENDALEEIKSIEIEFLNKIRTVLSVRNSITNNNQKIKKLIATFKDDITELEKEI